MNTFRAKVGPEGITAPAGTLLLVPGENLRTGIKDFQAKYADYTSLENDLLTVASAIYACDLAFRRGEREEITRSVVLQISVVNHQAFKVAKQSLELLLWTLTHDNWTIEFKRIDGQPESQRNWPEGEGSTILFSGGVDSFAGALELLTNKGRNAVQLASHITANPVTRQSQDDLVLYLSSRFGGAPNKITVRSGGRKRGQYLFPSDGEREETQRTRSFMYLAVAALGARRSGHDELVVIAENGQMAIHLPLSTARIGAFSTHTAHPEFVAQAVQFFSSILDFNCRVTNPFLYKTKAEVVSTIIPSDRPALAQSVSCWRGSRVSSYNHCGDCVPCLVRRIAFEQNGIALSEYKRDLFAENVVALGVDDEGKRNLIELAEFAKAFLSLTDAELLMQFPDLISTDFDQAAAIAMYRRFAVEARTVLDKYDGTKMLLASGGKQSGTNQIQPAGTPKVNSK